ncbi:MAG: hypothetical protein P4L10_14225 [Acidobacteriaceae bacterium]|nr:hypothetical protein [Acidobacteriaceae bacterium]
MKCKALPQGPANSNWRWHSYVSVAIAIVAFLVFIAFHPLWKWDESYDKWAKAALYTSCLFGYLLKWGWHYRKARRFWALLGCLFVLHVVVFAPFLLSLVAGHGLSIALVLGVGGMFEFILLALAIALLMEKERRKVE